uniref:SWIM-type domain-containing protein n=1 Tax=Magallana gigas TaxID=29159 RepID=A0A8W8IHF2_MAGGI
MEYIFWKSQRKLTLLLLIWLRTFSREDENEKIEVTKATGHVLSAYCSCTSGLGQTCNHVAGLLFRIESANKLGLTSCTSGTCIWVKPSEKKLQPAQIKSMNFKKSRHGKSVARPLVGKSKADYDVMPEANNDTEACIQKTLLASLKDAIPNACVFKGMHTTDDQDTTQLPVPVNQKETADVMAFDVSNYYIDNMVKNNVEHVTETEVQAINNLTMGISKHLSFGGCLPTTTLSMCPICSVGLTEVKVYIGCMEFIMTALLPITSGVSQQFQQGVDEEMINIINSIIIILTGYPPVNAEHVYHLLQHIYTFPHPYRTIREHTGGTLPIPLTVAASLPGWENVAPQQMNFMHAVFNHILEQDQKLVRDLFYRQLGRAPTVQEFAQFLLNFEGNELVESPRKTLGIL